MGYLKPVLTGVDGWVMETVERIAGGRLAADKAMLATSTYIM
jgi:hypothetical protein